MKEKNFSPQMTAIVQARMTSTRLPGKVLADIEDKLMLWYVANRLKFSKRLDDITLTIPDTQENNRLEKFVKKNNYFL